MEFQRAAPERRSAWIAIMCAAAISAVALLGSIFNEAASAATPIDLGLLPGSSVCQAEAVNDFGQAVGSCFFAGTQELHAFSWTAARGMVDLGTLGGKESNASAVNNSGKVVGYARTGTDAYRAFSWTRKTGMVDLGTLGGDESEAAAINEHGEIVGFAQTSNGADHAVSWTRKAGMVDLGTLGGENSFANSLSKSGDVAGWSDTEGNSRPHAFLWTRRDGMIDVGTAGGRFSFGYAVNDFGQVVGRSASLGGIEEGFSWTPGGGMSGLGLLSREAGSGSESEAVAVNDAGEVIGWSTTGEEKPHGDPEYRHAFIWTQEQGLVDLGALGGKESRANAINKYGRVVGTASVPPAVGAGGDGSPHAFLWTPKTGMIDLGTLGGSESEALAVSNSGWIAGQAEDKGGVRHPVLWKTRH